MRDYQLDESSGNSLRAPLPTDRQKPEINSDPIFESAAGTAARLGATRQQGVLLSRSVLHLQRTYGNRYTQQLLSSQSPTPSHIQRQPEYPPDWQHGAPTKPVAPDPHVDEIPGPGQQPDQGPYRTPGKPTEDPAPESSTRERIAQALRKAGIPAWAVAGLIVLIIAAIADPEPFSKVALIIGSAAAVIFFIAIGRGGDVPSTATASASTPAADNQPEQPAAAAQVPEQTDDEQAA